MLIGAKKFFILLMHVNAWTPAEWACAMAGECGEACNAVKKRLRFADGIGSPNDPQSEEEALEKIAAELADTVIYADLLAARLGIDLGEAIKQKFNKVSIERGSMTRL